MGVSRPRRENGGYPVLQANLQRSRVATAELVKEASERGTAFALVQEPYVGGVGEMRTYPGVRVVQCERQTDAPINKAAILVFDGGIDIIRCPTLITENIAVARLRTRAWEVVVVSIYLEGDKPLEPYVEHIGKVVAELGRGNVLMGGDVNAWNTWWGSREVDHRGEEVAGMLDDLGLHLLNQGLDPTFDTYRGGVRYSSHVDITACSAGILGLVGEWKVRDDITVSDHAAISFNLKVEKTVGLDIKSNTRKYNTKKANWGQFHEKLTRILQAKNMTKNVVENINNTEQLEIEVNKYTDTITKICKETIPKISRKKRAGLPWWTEELTAMKKELMRKKRRIKCASSVRREWVVNQYLKAREEYLAEAQRAQTTSWKEFCGKQERESMWDGIYRVINGTEARQADTPLVRDGRVLEGAESADLLAGTFYSGDRLEDDNVDHVKIREAANGVNGEKHGETCDPPFTMEELKWSSASFNPKKAPGQEGFTADICKAAIAACPDLFLALLNKCLTLSHFPAAWKEAVVVVLRKAGKTDYTHPKSYRPIGLLPVLGKILEKMLVRRIRWHVLPRMSDRQYGFTPQRGTEDSLYVMIQYLRQQRAEKKITVVVSLDIEGAFDNAWWPAVRCRLAEAGCPVNLRRLVDSYLEQRKVRVRYAGSESVRVTTKGCVQGSIGGPTFWNLLLDPLLRGLQERGDYAQAFADDVVLIVSGTSGSEIQRRTNAALEYVRGWGVRNKLKFGPHKTQAMVVTRKLVYDVPALSMGGVCIGLSKEIKILGLTVDEGLTFNTHVLNVCRKALSLYRRLSRAAKIHWGLNSEIIRTIYVAVIEPTIMYAASAWAPAANKLCVRKQLDAVQRGFVRKLVKAYRTVSLNSALILSGLLPLDLRIREVALLYELKKGYAQGVLGDREVERPVAFTELPHPATHAGLAFGGLDDGTDNDQEVESIYTDGSKIEGRVGAALTLWKGGREVRNHKARLEPHCSVYQAEMWALYKAAETAEKRGAPNTRIYCDSRSALESVTDETSLHPLAVKTRALIYTARSRAQKIELFWVKAHVGLEGNERADVLAKDAALKLKTKAVYDSCPISYVKRQIRKRTLDDWNRRYMEAETAGTTKLFFPDAVEAYATIRKVELDPLIVQIMTGHGGFSQYLHRFKCKESPACLCDEEKEETVEHLLVECPIYGENRMKLEFELDVRLSAQTISQIMQEKKSRDSFLDYCRSICKLVNKRNK